jgi:hypothetical protein
MIIQSNNLTFTASPDVVSSVHENGIVLLHIPNGLFFASNTIGARIWRGVEERQSLGMMVKDMSRDYQIDSMTAQTHVEGFLIELERRKLIQRETVS